MLSQQTVKDSVIEYINDLPPMPDYVRQLQQLHQEDRYEASRIIEMGILDPEICFELINIINLHSFDTVDTLETIEEAIEKIGPMPLSMMICASFASGLIRKHFSDPIMIEDYFDHATAVARSARILAKKAKLGKDHIEYITIAGLLHDIGRLIIDYSDDEIEHFKHASLETLIKELEEESMKYGLNHSGVGYMMAKKWNLVPEIQQALLRHHNPIMGGNFSIEGAIVFLAHYISASNTTQSIYDVPAANKLFDLIGITPEDYFQTIVLFSKD